MTLEVVVRPMLLPNIRPNPPRILARSESGLATIGGGGGKFVGQSYSFSVNITPQTPYEEQKRQVNTERVHQVDPQGNINKQNYIDYERTTKVMLDDKSTGGSAGTVKEIYADPPRKDNIEVLETGKTIIPPNLA